MTRKLLEVKNLSVEFSLENKKIRAIDNISFEVKKGEVIGIVGESGCGKSTLSRSIIYLLPKNGQVTNGQIIFEGKDILKLSKKEKRCIRGSGIGMVFQDSMSSLNPVRTIGKQFIEAINSKFNISKSEALLKAEKILSKVNLYNGAAIMKKYSFQLSGGMRQRVMIAMAMVLNPKILIADEPTTALDVTVQAQVIKQLKKLSDEYKTSIILVSHNLGVISQIADRIAVMYGGKIVEYGNAEIIFNKPSHPYTKALIRSVPRIFDEEEDKLFSIKGQAPSMDSLPDGCIFHPRCLNAKEECSFKRPLLKEKQNGVKTACHLV